MMKNIKGFILGLVIAASITAFAAGTSENIFKIGDKAASDKDFIFDNGSGATNPAIRWDESAGKITFSNDGSTYFNIGSDAASVGSPYEITNAGFSSSVGASALTINLKQADGSTDPSTDAASVKIGFRSSTITSGAFNQRSVTSSLSIVVPSGATLGHKSTEQAQICLYAIDNAGTVELAVSSYCDFDESALLDTTAISAAADSIYGLYSTVARSSVPARLIAKGLSTQTTAGTWAANLDRLAVASFPMARETRVYGARIAMPGTPDTNGEWPTYWISGFTDNGGGDTTINFITGAFPVAPSCTCTADQLSSEIVCMASSVSTTSIRIQTLAGSPLDSDFNINCSFPRK